MIAACHLSALVCALTFPLAMPGQEQATETKQIVVLLDNLQKIQMAKGRLIKSAVVANAHIARLTASLVQPVSTVQLEGCALGSTHLTLTDSAGKVETYEVVVRSNRLTLLVGNTLPLRMTNKQPLRRVFNENDRVVRITPVLDDPTTVLVTGVAVGRTRIVLTGQDGNEELLESGKLREKK